MNRAAIRARLPHGAAMCLLETVTCWDAAQIEALGVDYRGRLHPLARNGRLAAIVLLEYGAQAAGLHAVLSARADARGARRGVVASIAEARGLDARLGAAPGPARVFARQLAASGQGLIYETQVRVAGAEVAARITLMATRDRAAAVG